MTSRYFSRQGSEVLRIIEDGMYISTSGKTVNLKNLIINSQSFTVNYPPGKKINIDKNVFTKTNVEINNETTLSAAKRLIEQGYSTVILNLASGVSPGGGFLSGAQAQEEYLARSSALYATIKDSEMYAINNASGDSMFTDHAIYSPDVPVFRSDNDELLDEPYLVSIITSAAVNIRKLDPSRSKDIEEEMRNRISKVLSIGARHKHDAIVLGAWGCGAYGNDPWLIARLFKLALETNCNGIFKKVVFAILDNSRENKNIGPFTDIFQRTKSE